MKDLEYQECASCAAKSGAPELCSACLHNRAVVETLKAELEKVKKERDVLQASLEFGERIIYGIFKQSS